MIDPAILSALASAAVTALVPLLHKAAEKGAEELGKSTAGTLFDKLKSRLLTKASAQEALEDLAKAPQDETNQDLVKAQITKALKEQPALADELRAWLAETGSQAVVAQTMNVNGDGNKLIQNTGAGSSFQIS